MHKVLKQERGNFNEKKNCVLGWKTAKEVGFFAVSKSALERFGFLLHDSDDPQTHKTTIQSEVQRVATIKKACLGKRTCVSDQKNV